ncbi:CheR family methyltransferase [Ramlibacter humi]|uniref:Chemotaxis protein methyltransferase n=1 Tax=Ramlibacter humi TaxID=2530451 RepID=A0A4Z0CBD7_9BURK|nr:CheR family methyltransferase [Ramlibacter humi]TFZ08324.1 chemotaxis protein CheR [Ramlibacter humi]
MTAAALAYPGTSSQDVAFDAADFQRVRALIRTKAGIDLHPGKQNMVYGRLSRRLRETRHGSFRDYLDALERTGGDEWQEFINCLTTNLTSFFREPHHFELLAAELKKTPATARRIWSCAASTGEEPYSIAMTAAESGASVKIDASDIDTRVLAQARAGVYAMENVSSLGAERLRCFFQRGTGAHEGKARVKAELRERVSFRAFNLLASGWDARDYDAVFCRNVMIYFDRPTQRQVLERLHGALRPGGLLYAGHSENFSEHRDLFVLTGKTVYRRAG